MDVRLSFGSALGLILITAPWLSGCGEDDLSEITSLSIEGKVTLGSSVATQVHVTGRCGGSEVSTTTDDDGEYRLTSPVGDCTPLVIEFNKESYLPNFRVVPFPPPASPLTVDVPLAEMHKLQCGTSLCTADSNRIQMKADPMRQGWVDIGSGPSSLAFIPGEFRTTEGGMILFLGYSFGDYRDASGTTQTDFSSRDACVGLAKESLDWLGDVLPRRDDPADPAEVGWFRLDPTTGRWWQEGLAVISYTRGNKCHLEGDKVVYEKDPATGEYIENIQPMGFIDLLDVRADMFYKTDGCTDALKKISKFWVCGPEHDSGWYAFGLDIGDRVSCFNLQAKDQCENPVPNIVYSMKGRDHGYRAEAWTGRTGKACLQVAASEEIGVNHDFDDLMGETFWVDITLRYAKSRSEVVKSYENPGYDSAVGDCAHPEACTQIEHQVTTAEKCP